MLNFTRKYIASLYAISALIGLSIPFYINISNTLIYFILLLAASYSLTLYLYKPKSAYLYLIIIVSFMGLYTGLHRGQVSEDSSKSQLKKYYNSKVTLVGVISEYPDTRTDRVYLTLGNIKVQSDEKENKELITEKVLVRADLYPEYRYGESLQVMGKITAPHQSVASSTNRFSYSKYLSVRDIYSTIDYGELKSLEPPARTFIGFLYGFKDKCIKVVTSYIPEPAAGLLVGILFGIKKALPNELLQIFITAGVIHIIVLSGYNIAVVVSAVTKLFARVPRRTRYILSYFSIFVFVLFVGASSTALRAGVMASIALFSKQVGREGVALQVLLLATLVIGLYDPKLIVYDISFQLSFLAILGLIVFTPSISSKLRYVPEYLGLREILASTLATQITVVPLLLYTMGSISIIGFVANIFIVPLVPLAMLLGFVTILLGLIYLPLSLLPAYGTYILLWTILSLAKVFALLPVTTVSYSIGYFTVFILYIFELFLGYYLFSSGSGDPGNM